MKTNRDEAVVKTTLSGLFIMLIFAVAMLFTTLLQTDPVEPVPKPEHQEIVPGTHFVKE